MEKHSSVHIKFHDMSILLFHMLQINSFRTMQSIHLDAFVCLPLRTCFFHSFALGLLFSSDQVLVVFFFSFPHSQLAIVNFGFQISLLGLLVWFFPVLYHFWFCSQFTCVCLCFTPIFIEFNYLFCKSIQAHLNCQKKFNFHFLISLCLCTVVFPVCFWVELWMFLKNLCSFFHVFDVCFPVQY